MHPYREVEIEPCIAALHIPEEERRRADMSLLLEVSEPFFAVERLKTGCILSRDARRSSQSPYG